MNDRLTHHIIYHH